MPSFDGGDDFVWVLGPGKGLGIGVGVIEEAVDGIFEFAEGSEHARLRRFFVSLAKKPSTALSHEADVGVK